MNKNSRLLLLLFISSVISLQSSAQILPKERSKLNYRIIGFRFPAAGKSAVKTSTYKLEIAKGYYNNIDSFKKNIVVSQNSSSNKLIAEVPFWGCKYTWRVTYAGKPEKGRKAKLYHFRTDTIIYDDTNYARLRIKKTASKYGDAYVFLDDTKGLYDMQGNMVWFMPKVDSSENDKVKLRDIKMAADGGITCITSNDAVREVDYSGKMLWEKKTINGRNTPKYYYHHQFSRLENGHYMAICSIRIPEHMHLVDGEVVMDSTEEQPQANDQRHRDNMAFDLIMEYDEDGKLVWSWNPSEYCNKLIAAQQGKSRSRNPRDPLHANAFFFDEKKSELYVSFRDVSQVVKLKYPSGEVMQVYGASGSFNVTDQQASPFCMQHACKVSKAGDLYLFDNNSCEDPGIPKVVMIRQPRTKKEHAKVIWEYECPSDATWDTATELLKVKERAYRTAGGNVIELPDHSIFVSSCRPYGDVFIVTRDKKVLWSAIAEEWNKYAKKWQPDPQYRASIILGKKQLERMIWKGYDG